MLNDEKMVAMISDYNGLPAEYDCILNVIIEGGLNGIDPQLLGDAVLIDKEASPDKAGEILGAATKIAGKASWLLGGVLGDVADAVGNASDELANDGAILTLGNGKLSFYILNKMGSQITCCAHIPIEKIEGIRKSKMLLWHTVRLYFSTGCEIKINITSKQVGIKNQKENLDKFLNLLNN